MFNPGNFRRTVRSWIVLAIVSAAALASLAPAIAGCLNHFEHVNYPCCDDCKPGFDTYPAHCDWGNPAEDCTFVSTNVCASCQDGTREDCFGAYDSVKSCNASCFDCGS